MDTGSAREVVYAFVTLGGKEGHARMHIAPATAVRMAPAQPVGMDVFVIPDTPG